MLKIPSVPFETAPGGSSSANGRVIFPQTTIINSGSHADNDLKALESNRKQAETREVNPQKNQPALAEIHASVAFP